MYKRQRCHVSFQKPEAKHVRSSFKPSYTQYWSQASSVSSIVYMSHTLKTDQPSSSQSLTSPRGHLLTVLPTSSSILNYGNITNTNVACECLKSMAENTEFLSTVSTCFAVSAGHGPREVVQRLRAGAVWPGVASYRFGRGYWLEHGKPAMSARHTCFHVFADRTLTPLSLIHI